TAAASGCSRRGLPRAAYPVWIERERHSIAHSYAPDIGRCFDHLASSIRAGNELRQCDRSQSAGYHQQVAIIQRYGADRHANLARAQRTGRWTILDLQRIDAGEGTGYKALHRKTTFDNFLFENKKAWHGCSK